MTACAVHIACSVSHAYLLPLAVVLHSLVEQLRPGGAPYRAVLGGVASTFAREATGTRERLVSWYDRHARDLL